MRTIRLNREEWIELITTVQIALEDQVMEPESRVILEKVFKKIDEAPNVSEN